MKTMNTISLLSLLSLLLLATSDAAAPKKPKKPKKAKNSKTLGSNTVIAGATCWTSSDGVSNSGNLNVDFGTTGYATRFEVAPGSSITTDDANGVMSVYESYTARYPYPSVNAAIVANGITYVVSMFAFDTNFDSSTLTILWAQQGEQAEVPVPSVPEESAIDCTVFIGEDSSTMF